MLRYYELGLRSYFAYVIVQYFEIVKGVVSFISVCTLILILSNIKHKMLVSWFAYVDVGNCR